MEMTQIIRINGKLKSYLLLVDLLLVSFDDNQGSAITIDFEMFYLDQGVTQKVAYVKINHIGKKDLFECLKCELPAFNEISIYMCQAFSINYHAFFVCQRCRKD